MKRFRSIQNSPNAFWGCDNYCPADALRCGNGTIRTPHPIELFGEEWLESELKSNQS
jgi:hypothetical protein